MYLLVSTAMFMSRNLTIIGEASRGLNQSVFAVLCYDGVNVDNGRERKSGGKEEMERQFKCAMMIMFKLGGGSIYR